MADRKIVFQAEGELGQRPKDEKGHISFVELKEKEVEYSCSIQPRQEPTHQKRTSSEDTEMMRTRIRHSDFTLRAMRIHKMVYERKNKISFALTIVVLA